MKHIKYIQILFIVIILSAFSGCMDTNSETPAATSTSTVTVQETVAVSTPTITPADTARTPLSYKVYVDEYYGFRKVIETTYTKEVEYQNLTLTIYSGDTVEWVNDNDYKITLVSDQGLWTPGEIRAILMNRGFNYTFTTAGTYTFRIKEEPRVLPQTIIVKQ
ncbi:MAG: hypothetical protein KKG76_11645 [Euryarchaeota archaeon]|nr:hypothetical protein [Euryarchaeota archaeon]